MYQVAGDRYKDQLVSLCTDAARFRVRDLPGYTETALTRYFQRYNACFLGETILYRAPQPRYQVDLGLAAGVETRVGWLAVSEAQLLRPTYGLSLRISQPRRHYNRFFKASLMLTPDVPAVRTYFFSPKVSHRTLTRAKLTLGSYFGGGRLRPFLTGSAVFGFIQRGGNGMLLTLGAGLSYKRRLDVEVGHPVSLSFIHTGLTDGQFLIPRG